MIANNLKASHYVIEEDKNSGRSVIRQREIGTFFQMPLKLA